MLATLRQHLCSLVDLFLPAACPFCGTPLGEGDHATLCNDCLSGIAPLPQARCPLCALPYITEHGTAHLCGDCLSKPPPFSRVDALGIYDGVLRSAIHRFKYQGAISLDQPLAGLLRQTLEERTDFSPPELIVPVPLHFSRLRERTYNQALLLARKLGRHWGTPTAARRLLRTRPSEAQQGLSASERQLNLKEAFALSAPLQGERVLLIDDVMTTGATAKECSRTLLCGGASEVTVAVLARAPRHH